MRPMIRARVFSQWTFPTGNTIQPDSKLEIVQV